MNQEFWLLKHYEALEVDKLFTKKKYALAYMKEGGQKYRASPPFYYLVGYDSDPMYILSKIKVRK